MLVASRLTSHLVGCNLRFSGRLELVVGGIEGDQGIFVGVTDFLELMDMASSVSKVNLGDLQSRSVWGSEPAIG